VECATRQEDDSWLLRETSDLHGTIQLPSIECSFSLADAYRSVQFARDEP
jgi:hypothetical protein